MVMWIPLFGIMLHPFLPLQVMYFRALPHSLGYIFSVCWGKVVQHEWLVKNNRGLARRGTHLYAHDFAPLLGFLLYSVVWRKTTKYAITLDSLYNRIWNFTWVCVLIFLSLSCNLVLWYELKKKFWDIWLYFPIPDCGERKPTWRSRVRWLPKFAWYDVTWKHSIMSVAERI